jgi:hypothetical protein
MACPTDADKRSALAAGDRVRLQGLISRSDLNGSVACILEPSSSVERDALEIQGRIKVTGLTNVGAPKSLSVKRENIVSLGDAAVDWTFRDSPKLSLLELVRAGGVPVYVYASVCILCKKGFADV